MCEPSNQPRFKPGDKTEYNEGGGRWVPVTIWTRALRYMDDKQSLGYVHGVTFADERTNIVYVDNLRPVERWVKCEGTHRWADTTPCSKQWENMERLVE
jgi:hypothetical protein